MGKKGGKQPGSGRPKGSKNKATLEKQAVLDAFNQRVMLKADALFNAQLTLAVGSMKVFRIDEEGEGKNKKRVHSLVTDPHEIKALLDEHDGCAGVVEGVFYYFSDVLPDNKAIEAMLNRSLGKAPEKITINVTELDADIERELALLNAGRQDITSGAAESVRKSVRILNHNFPAGSQLAFNLA